MQRAEKTAQAEQCRNLETPCKDLSFDGGAVFIAPPTDFSGQTLINILRAWS
jgi:hypothetical protein